jgi:hypothetical protein
MRRAAALVVAAAFSLASAGCGGDDTSTSKASPSQSASLTESPSGAWDQKQSGDQYLAIVEAGNSALKKLQDVGATAAGQELFTADQIASINTICADLVRISGERNEKLADGNWGDEVRPAIDDLVVSGGNDQIAYRKCAGAKDTAEISAAVDDLVKADSSSKAAVVREALGLPGMPQVKGPNA